MQLLKPLLFLAVSLFLFSGSALAQSSSTHTSTPNPSANNDTYEYDIKPGTTNPNVTEVKNKAGVTLKQVSNPTAQDEYRVDITENADGSYKVTITFGDTQKKGEKLTVTTERDGGSTPSIDNEAWSN